MINWSKQKRRLKNTISWGINKSEEYFFLKIILLPILKLSFCFCSAIGHLFWHWFFVIFSSYTFEGSRTITFPFITSITPIFHHSIRNHQSSYFYLSWIYSTKKRKFFTFLKRRILIFTIETIWIMQKLQILMKYFRCFDNF